MKDNLIIPILNWKNIFGYRQIIPYSVEYESYNKYHDNNVWILNAVDVDKGEFRDYDFEGLTKGVIFHTLMQIAEGNLSNTFDKTVDLIYENIKIKYKENNFDKE